MVQYVSSGDKAPGTAIGRAISQVAQLLATGQIDQARSLLEQLRRQAPDHPDVLHLAGHMELAHGRVDSGIALIKQAVRRHPKAPMYHYNLGLAHAMKKDFVAAKKAFQQAVRLGQRDKDTLDNLAICQQQLGRLKEAKTIFQEVVRRLPNDGKSWLDLAKVNLELNSLDEVQDSLSKAEQLSSAGPAENWKEIAKIYLLTGPMHKAVAASKQGIALDPRDGDLWYLKGQALYEESDYSGAEASYQQAEARGFDALKLQFSRARLFITSGRVANGRRLLDDIRAKAAGDVDLLLAAAQLYSLIGVFDEEEKCLLEALRLDPENVGAQVALAFVPGRKLEKQAVALMESHIDDTKIERRSRTSMGFALGNHFRNIKEFDKAFKYYKKGNQYKGYSWDRAAYRQWVNRTLEIYTPGFFAERAGWGLDARTPILIVGMPRSGTTLSEQILSSHSDVVGAGEFGTVAGLCAGEGVEVPPIVEDADSILSVDEALVNAMAANHLKRLKDQAQHGEHFVTNKLPHNFQQVGLFGLLFPKAPVIHIRRDPRDNLLSIYFQDFGGYHPYAYDLKNLAFEYWEQERLMEHWRSVVPNPVFTLNYEELVGDLEGMIQRLADFLGITVEEAMKKFYEQERKVQTASKWQVRQKLYTTSMARWKPYEKHLKPLFDALREFAPADSPDEYGIFEM